MKREDREALEGALRKLGVPEAEITRNPTKAGIRFVFGALSSAKPDSLPTPSKDHKDQTDEWLRGFVEKLSS